MNRKSDLGKHLAAIRSAYLQDFSGPGGATLSLFGSPASQAWTAFESADADLARALRRDDRYEPVAAMIVSFSTSAGVYVAARYWVGPDHGVKDLMAFSSGPVVTALVHSGYAAQLAGNPRWRHVKNIDPRLRAEHGYELRHNGWWYPGHHFDVADPSTSMNEQTVKEVRRSAREFLERIGKGTK